MLNGIRNSKPAKLISGLMLASIILSFYGGIFSFSTLNIANNRSESIIKVSSKALTGQKQKALTVANRPIPNEQTGLEQSYSYSVSNRESQPPVQRNKVAWKPVPNAQQSKQTGSPNPKSGPNVDLYLLARVIYAEARGEPFQGQVAVGAVLLNRLKDARFPKSLAQIIFKQGEFCTVRDGQIWKTPDRQALQAARLAAAGWDPTGGALYFYNPAKTTSRWIWSRPIVNRIGNHNFAI